MPASYTNELPNVLADIPAAELHRRRATLTLARRALEPNHLLHHKIISPELRQSRCLKSRHPFVPAAKELLSNLNQLDVRAADWAEDSWRSEWNNCNTRLHHFICINTPPPGMHLQRRSWVQLNHLCTGVGQFRSSLHTCFIHLKVLLDWSDWMMTQLPGCMNLARTSNIMLIRTNELPTASI